MSNKEVIEGLRDLIKDRESFIQGDMDHDSIFEHDAQVLREAVRLIEDRETPRTAICVFCKAKARLNGMLTRCDSCRYGGADE